MEYFTSLHEIEEFLKNEQEPGIILKDIENQSPGYMDEYGTVYSSCYTKDRSDSDNSVASDMSVCTMDFKDVKDVKIVSTRKRKMATEPKACAVCEAPTQYSHYGKV